MRTICLPACALVFSLSLIATAGDLPAEFADQCEPALAKMQQAYEHATIRGTFHLTFPKGGPKAPARTLDFELRTDGEKMALTESGGFDEHSQGQAAQAPRQLEVNSAGARIREGVSTWQTTDPGNARGYIGWVTQIRQVYGKHLLDFLGNPARTIDSVERISENGREIVRVTCQWDDAKTHMHNTGIYDLSPSEGWALRRYENDWQPTSGDDPPGRYLIRVDYDGQEDGVPLIKRAEEALSHGPKFETEQLTVVDFTAIRFAQPASGPHEF